MLLDIQKRLFSVVLVILLLIAVKFKILNHNWLKVLMILKRFVFIVIWCQIFNFKLVVFVIYSFLYNIMPLKFGSLIVAKKNIIIIQKECLHLQN